MTDSNTADSGSSNANMDMSAFGLPSSFGGAKFSEAGPESEAPTTDSHPGSQGQTRGRGRGRGHFQNQHNHSRGGQRGRGRGRGSGAAGPYSSSSRPSDQGWGGRVQQQQQHDGQDASLSQQRTPQAFFKPSFLEDPWAHLTKAV